MDPALLVVVMVVIPIILTFALAPRLLGPMLNRIVHGSAKKQAMGEELKANGAKARAMVISIQPTGTVVNKIYIQCVVDFRMEPLDGSAQFAGQKTAFLAQTQLPRQGDVMPCWYDADDRSSFVVGIPDLADPETRETLRSFGIADPLESVR